MSAGGGQQDAGVSLLTLLEQQAGDGWTAQVVATPGPEDGLRDDLTPQDVSPGLLGFVVIFAAAVACIPLFLSMTRKLRKVDPRRERPTAAPAPEDGAADDGAGPFGDGPGDAAVPGDGAVTGEGAEPGADTAPGADDPRP